MQKPPLSLFAKILLSFTPGWGMIKKMHQLFASAERVDVLPTEGIRGFRLVLNNRFAIYFFQDGDNFAYDGFEVGEYETGEVTIFD